MQTSLQRIKTQMKHLLCITDEQAQSAPAKQVEEVIHAYLIKTVYNFDLKTNVVVSTVFLGGS